MSELTSFPLLLAVRSQATFLTSLKLILRENNVISYKIVLKFK